MKWRKLGLIYSASSTSHWDRKYGILPTPVLLDHNVIRIFFASTDEDRIGYISYLDVDSKDPTKIIRRSGKPILGPGLPGTFDDCGVNASCVLRVGDRWHLYYYGYQRSVKTPFNLFSGLAVSEDGATFAKVSDAPVVDRNDEEYIIRSAPCVIKDGDMYRMWYVSASGWEKMSGGIFDGRLMPRYHIRCMSSRDAMVWDRPSVVCSLGSDPNEFGFGRPWVILKDGRYRMWFSVRHTNVPYRLGYAESSDGLTWKRQDEQAAIPRSPDGWDSQMICYASVIEVGGRTFLFYNGNNNGETGFGCAERIN